MTLLKLAIGIALIIISIKFFIKLLPLIIVGLILILVYDSLKKNGFFEKKKKEKNEVVEAEIIKEKKND